MDLTETQKVVSRVTEQGKRNSSRNAAKHGFFANSLLVEHEFREHFDPLLNSLTTFNPQDAAECMHVETIAAARWRQSHLWAVPSAGINHEIRRQAPNMTDENAATRVMLAMRTLSLYEHRFDRQQRDALEVLDRLKQRRSKENSAGTERTWEPDENKDAAPKNEPEPEANEPEPEANQPDLKANEPEPEVIEPEQLASIGGPPAGEKIKNARRTQLTSIESS